MLVILVLLLVSNVGAGASGPTDSDRPERWIGIDDGIASALAISPDGERLYVAGSARGSNDRADIAVAAFDAFSGIRHWLARYAPGDAVASEIAVSRDGRRIYVSGRVDGEEEATEKIVTIAYRADDGTRLWTASYEPPTSDFSEFATPASLTADPQRDRVYMVGEASRNLGADFIIAGYSGRTGDELWRQRVDGPHRENAYDFPTTTAITRDGRTLYVSGTSLLSSRGLGIVGRLTVVLRTDTGKIARTLVEKPPDGYNELSNHHIVLSKDEMRLFVLQDAVKYEREASGRPTGETSDVIVGAYSARSGESRWRQCFCDPETETTARVFTGGSLIANRGHKLFVAFSKRGRDEVVHSVVIASLVQGSESVEWASTIEDPERSIDPVDLELNPATKRIHLTASSAVPGGFAQYDRSDYLTATYARRRGRIMWTARYNSSPLGDHLDFPAAVAVAPDGSRVFVTGRDWSDSSYTGSVAYDS